MHDREEFEDWAEKNGLDTSMWDSKAYYSAPTSLAWKVWEYLHTTKIDVLNAENRKFVECNVERLKENVGLQAEVERMRQAAEEALYWLARLNAESLENHTQVERARQAENNLRAELNKGN